MHTLAHIVPEFCFEGISVLQSFAALIQIVESAEHHCSAHHTCIHITTIIMVDEHRVRVIPIFTGQTHNFVTLTAKLDFIVCHRLTHKETEGTSVERVHESKNMAWQVNISNSCSGFVLFAFGIFLVETVRNPGAHADVTKLGKLRPNEIRDRTMASTATLTLDTFLFEVDCYTCCIVARNGKQKGLQLFGNFFETILFHSFAFWTARRMAS
jgi:hypothetical protein